MKLNELLRCYLCYQSTGHQCFIEWRPAEDCWLR